MMQLGTNGEVIIKAFEKLVLTAYKPTPKDNWTIGWGHTGPGVTQGVVWDTVVAEEYFRRDVMAAGAKVISTTDVPLTQNQFDALVSFTFNVGVTAEGHSTLIKLVNARQWAAAADQFLLWDKQDGVVLAGLTARRVAERTLFLHP